MGMPASWKVIAHNRAKDSENKIHDDRVARKYGFRGGLVPGVTVHGYLSHPAVEAWGVPWLERGLASVFLKQPVYEEEELCVETEAQSASRYRAEVRGADGTVRAYGTVSCPDHDSREIPQELAAPPVYREDPLVDSDVERPDATREALETLRCRGMRALPARFDRDSEISLYTRDPNEMPAMLRPDEGGFASPAYTLGLANWILAANVRLGPWIHVESEVLNHAAIPAGSRLVVEARVLELFERGGHELVDLDVSGFIEPDTPAFQARHRAIYRLREPAPSGPGA